MPKEETIKFIADVALSLSTIALAFFTYRLAKATVRLSTDGREASENQVATWERTSLAQIKNWERTSNDQMGVQTWLTLEARFDSTEMKRARGKTAIGLQSYGQALVQMNNASIHYRLTEDIFDLFESIETLHRLGLINCELAESSFSFYLVFWWEAGKTYIQNERKRQGDDASLFKEFEFLANEWRDGSKTITQAELTHFLNDERFLLN